MSLTSDILAFLENQSITSSNGDITTWQGQSGLESKTKFGRDRMITLEHLPGDAPDTHVVNTRGARLRVQVRDKQHAYESCLTKFLAVFDLLQDQTETLNADAEVSGTYHLFHSDDDGPVEVFDKKDRPNMSAVFRVEMAK
jgi:hypothetical protein